MTADQKEVLYKLIETEGGVASISSVNEPLMGDVSSELSQVSAKLKETQTKLETAAEETALLLATFKVKMIMNWLEAHSDKTISYSDFMPFLAANSDLFDINEFVEIASSTGYEIPNTTPDQNLYLNLITIVQGSDKIKDYICQQLGDQSEQMKAKMSTPQKIIKTLSFINPVVLLHKLCDVQTGNVREDAVDSLYDLLHTKRYSTILKIVANKCDKNAIDRAISRAKNSNKEANAYQLRDSIMLDAEVTCAKEYITIEKIDPTLISKVDAGGDIKWTEDVLKTIVESFTRVKGGGDQYDGYYNAFISLVNSNASLRKYFLVEVEPSKRRDLAEIAKSNTVGYKVARLLNCIRALDESMDAVLEVPTDGTRGTIYTGFVPLLLAGVDSECGKYKDVNGASFDLVNSYLKLVNVKQVETLSPETAKYMKESNYDIQQTFNALRGQLMADKDLDAPAEEVMSDKPLYNSTLRQKLIAGAKVLAAIATVGTLGYLAWSNADTLMPYLNSTKTLLSGRLVDLTKALTPASAALSNVSETVKAGLWGLVDMGKNAIYGAPPPPAPPASKKKSWANTLLFGYLD
jgi:hypothetical protein